MLVCLFVFLFTFFPKGLGEEGLCLDACLPQFLGPHGTGQQPEPAAEKCTRFRKGTIAG